MLSVKGRLNYFCIENRALTRLKCWQSSFHVYNSTENENVTSNPARNFYAIVLDWYAMFAKNEIVDPFLSILNPSTHLNH